MIPVVNDQYKYIFLYSGKAGCTSLRQFYLALHQDEMSAEQRSALNWYHNINELQPLQADKDYSDYFTYLITRNPYSRIISAFLDQYVFSRSDAVADMIASHSNGDLPTNFLEFLQALQRVPDHERDSHFQTQSYFAHATMVVTPASPRYRWLKQKPPHAFGVQYMGDISGFAVHMKRVCKRVFKSDKAKLTFALSQIDSIKKSNSSFYGLANFDDAAVLSIEQLDELVFAPKPQDFLRSETVRNLIEEIYLNDFNLLSYPIGKWPSKNASPEVHEVPADLDWQMYIRLNPDLPRNEIYNERGVVRHYLEFGRFEEHPRAYKIEAPQGFDWQRYLTLNQDLVASGIDNEQAAIEHYISFGIREHRKT